MSLKLKEIRNQKGLTLKALAELSGVPQRTIEDIQKNDNFVEESI